MHISIIKQSTFHLGLVGLIQFLPALLLALPAGQVVEVSNDPD
jgi:hypothetical protein